MKLFKPITISFALLLIGTVSIYYFLYRTTDEKYDKNIAIFIPAIHPAMDEIERGIKETLLQNKTQSYSFNTYNANGNKTLLRAQADEIAQQYYDCVFTIGTVCTQTMFEITKKKEMDMPVVFTAVDDPVKIGIVHSLKSSGNNLTGSTIEDDFDKQFDALIAIKPTIKKVLFVYDPADGSGHEKREQTIEHVLKKRNISLKSVHIYQANEIQQKVEPLLDEDFDVIFIYTDHTTVSGVDSLITLCNRYNITLYASDLSSSDKGAAVAFGVTEYEHGKNAAQKALEILHHNKKPSEVPISPVENQKIKINTKTMKAQNLNLSDDDLARIKNEGGIII